MRSKIFAECLPAVAVRKARETTRLCEIVGLSAMRSVDYPVSDF